MPTAKIQGDIHASVRFDTERVDYGVPRSPEWDEIIPETMEIETLEIFGYDWTEKELRMTFGDQGAEAFLQLVFNQVEDWEDD